MSVFSGTNMMAYQTNLPHMMLSFNIGATLSSGCTLLIQLPVKDLGRKQRVAQVNGPLHPHEGPGGSSGLA